jgi:hypothetical protein
MRADHKETGTIVCKEDMNQVTVRRGKKSTSFTPSPPASRMNLAQGNYQFHRVFPMSTRNSDVASYFFDKSRSIMEPLFLGQNCTLFAYGQTGSGKTYTMSAHAEDTGHPQRGIMPHALQEVFVRVADAQKKGWHCKVRISMVQLYMERVLDMLEPDTGCLAVRQRTLLDGSVDVFVQGVSWKEVHHAQEAVALVVKGMLERTVASTNANAESSRSHCVCVVELEQMHMATGRHLRSALHLVDLAGSESVGRTGAQGMVLQQACNVNRSLTTLSQVIHALSRKAKHVPYRDSKLTRLLTHALGGNGQTYMILTCSLEEEATAETMSTLLFGHRALDMPNQPKVNLVHTTEDYQRMLTAAEKSLSEQRKLFSTLESTNALLLHENVKLASLVEPKHRPPADLHTVSEELNNDDSEEEPESPIHRVKNLGVARHIRTLSRNAMLIQANEVLDGPEMEEDGPEMEEDGPEMEEEDAKEDVSTGTEDEEEEAGDQSPITVLVDRVSDRPLPVVQFTSPVRAALVAREVELPRTPRNVEVVTPTAQEDETVEDALLRGLRRWQGEQSITPTTVSTTEPPVPAVPTVLRQLEDTAPAKREEAAKLHKVHPLLLGTGGSLMVIAMVIYIITVRRRWPMPLLWLSVFFSVTGALLVGWGLPPI